MNLRVRFPLWGVDARRLARCVLQDGVRALVTSVDATLVAPSFAGQAYDQAFLAARPEHVDPCGEEGAFHTFVHDGPLFRRPVNVRVGETRCGERRCHAVLKEGGHSSSAK